MNNVFLITLFTLNVVLPEEPFWLLGVKTPENYVLSIGCSKRSRLNVDAFKAAKENAILEIGQQIQANVSWKQLEVFDPTGSQEIDFVDINTPPEILSKVISNIVYIDSFLTNTHAYILSAYTETKNINVKKVKSLIKKVSKKMTINEYNNNGSTIPEGYVFSFHQGSNHLREKIIYCTKYAFIQIASEKNYKMSNINNDYNDGHVGYREEIFERKSNALLFNSTIKERFYNTNTNTYSILMKVNKNNTDIKNIPLIIFFIIFIR